MNQTFLVFGATGQTGSRFVQYALEQGDRVRVLVRDPAKLSYAHPELEVHQGSVTDLANLDDLVGGADFVLSMLGDAAMQQQRKINTEFVRELIPAMRRQRVTRFLYQAGGLSRAPGRRLSLALWVIKNTIARDFFGQHEDNEAVMSYLAESADDIEWVVHRASINRTSSSSRVLKRSHRSLSIASFQETAEYNYRTVMDSAAVHSFDFSAYRRG